MLPAINQTAGMNMGFPDPCLTPMGPVLVPVPYPNMAMHAMAVGSSPNVLLSFMPALHMASIIPLTLGDSPGVLPFTMKAGRFTMGNPIVLVNMLPGICLLCPTTGNFGNNPMGAVLVPGVTNVFYTYSNAPPPTRGDETAQIEGDPRATEQRMTGQHQSALADRLASSARPEGPPIESAMLSSEVGYIQIHVFSLDVPSRVHGAVRRLSEAGMREMVLDLRGNPGGDLTSFVELAGDFLPAGSVIAIVEDADGDETIHRSAQERPYSMPVTLLVDSKTASAAELFAECLASHGRASIAGGPMYGKHTGQAVYTTPDGQTQLGTVVRCRAGGKAAHA